MKIVPSLRLLYDITTYADLCSSIDIATSGLELVVTGSLDISDCNLGMFGSIYQLIMNNAASGTQTPELGRAFDCEERQYWFDKKPIYRLGLDNIVKKREAWE